MKEFELFFSDLNEDAQKRLLDYAGVSDPKEMNWDMDVFPIAILGPYEDMDEEENAQ